MNNKTKIFFLVFLLILACLFVGCGSAPEQKEEKKTHSKKEKVEQEAEEPIEPVIKENADNFPHIDAAIEEATEEVAEEVVEPEVPKADEKIYVDIFKKYGTDSGSEYAPFYGIWVFASLDGNDADDFYYSTDNWDNTYVLLSSDWDNLNSKPYYVVSIGKYETEDEAKSALSDVKKTYPDAYVKYSGNYKLPQDSDKRYELYVYALGNITDEGDRVEIKANTENGTVETYYIDSTTIFDESCDMEFFEEYVDGENVLSWYRRVMGMPAGSFEMGPPIMGVFDISVTGNHIDRYYGTYWWD